MQMREGCLGNCLVCGKCAGFAILDSFQTSIGGVEPQSKMRDDNSIGVEQRGGHEVALELREGYGIAVDIGTTTVVLALLDLSDGTVLARHSFMNPQRAFGPDVISRIHTANEGHLEELRRMIVQAVAVGLAELLAARGVVPVSVAHISIAGNTTMTHLLLGLPCESLGVIPFKPAFSLAERYAFADVFGDGNITCPLSIFPWFTAFVGGDIMAGLLHVLQENSKRFLLIDLGTNGEMALMDGNRLIVTSTAAGPAFESGKGGASGAIHALAELVRAGTVDETGLLEGEAVFTQRQIRDLQLAKSAVRSGLEILLEIAGLAYSDLDAVYLAGGIGQAMAVRDAVEIGLLPGELREKARAVGNASLGGAALLLCAPKAVGTDIGRLQGVAEEVKLAEHPRFNDCFMEYIGFE